MTIETEKWLGPMFSALLTSSAGAAAFARFMDMALIEAPVANGRESEGVNWVEVGQLIRDELRWYDYPASPTS